MIKTFEDLKCWQVCRELRLFVAEKIVPILPKDEKYRLSDQLLRASRSSTANIAEGYGRFHYMDNAKFCSNARGSCWEILDHLITAHDEELIDKNLLDSFSEDWSRNIGVQFFTLYYPDDPACPPLEGQSCLPNGMKLKLYSIGVKRKK